MTLKQTSIQQESALLKKQLEEDIVRHRDEEALASKKKFKIESEVENWIHKYDQDMEEKQIEIDDISVIFHEEKSHLDELQARFTDLQKEYESILDERRLAEDAKKVGLIANF